MANNLDILKTLKEVEGGLGAIWLTEAVGVGLPYFLVRWLVYELFEKED